MNINIEILSKDTIALPAMALGLFSKVVVSTKGKEAMNHLVQLWCASLGHKTDTSSAKRCLDDSLKFNGKRSNADHC
jgi:hypothetical protein